MSDFNSDRFLIKPAATPAGYRLCADIWLEASLAAHDFIDGCLWKDRWAEMAELYLPSAAVVTAAVPGQEPAAFSAMRGDTLEALFVRPAQWGCGFGRHLLRRLQARHEGLNLTVYTDNRRAVEFYLKQGFKVSGERLCAHSGASELVMVWQKTPAVAGEGF